MSARKKGWLRHPRTTQERRFNQDKYDLTVRAKRRNLPTSYDDFFISRKKCWKDSRKEQYRVADSNYTWHEFHYSYQNYCERHKFHKIMDQLERLGCYFEWTSKGIRWFGPEL